MTVSVGLLNLSQQVHLIFQFYQKMEKMIFNIRVDLSRTATLVFAKSI